MILRHGRLSAMPSPLMRLFRAFHNIFPLRPFRMYRRGRPVVSHFSGDEQLYRRYRRADSQNGVILPSALKFPNQGEFGQSVNRSSFSRPEDALWTPTERLDGWGVFEFPVASLPEDVTCSATRKRFTFFPKHVPIRKN